MRQWIAVPSLSLLLVLCGCQTEVQQTPAPTVRYIAAPQATAPVAPPPVALLPATTAPAPVPGTVAASPPPGGSYAYPLTPPVVQAQPPAPTVPAPGPDEIRQALRENEDALAALRTAQRALEASHNKLEELLRRQAAPPAVPTAPVPGLTPPSSTTGP
ncbi:MAG TPA: hypothetical protein VMS17_07585 [Gemmataceae bacterium]|nr:hypothetical protein [Gemmataceae bacterium]